MSLFSGALQGTNVLQARVVGDAEYRKLDLQHFIAFKTLTKRHLEFCEMLMSTEPYPLGWLLNQKVNMAGMSYDAVRPSGIPDAFFVYPPLPCIKSPSLRLSGCTSRFPITAAFVLHVFILLGERICLRMVCLGPLGNEPYIKRPLSYV